MITVYVMQTCPDCTSVKQLFQNDSRIQLVDIGEQARNLKQFLAMRDNHPAFAPVRKRGTIGIPCFILEDGSITFSLDKAMPAIECASAPTEENGEETGSSCSIDGKGC
jgi:glutaredoxin-related protein